MLLTGQVPRVTTALLAPHASVFACMCLCMCVHVHGCHRCLCGAGKGVLLPSPIYPYVCMHVWMCVCVCRSQVSERCWRRRLAPHPHLPMHVCACVSLCRCLCSAGEGVLLPSPIYPAFPNDMEVRGQAHMHLFTLNEQDTTDTTESVTQQIERAAKEAADRGHPVKVFLICNPNNPQGFV